MIYLESFRLPCNDYELDFFWSEKKTCYDNYYPFKMFSKKGLFNLEFEPITILYGSNGSGKTTLLNIIADRLQLARRSIYNKSSFFGSYVDLCDFTEAKAIPKSSKIITSDDVFDRAFDIRAINQGVDIKREELFEEYDLLKRTPYYKIKPNPLSDLEVLKKINSSKKSSKSEYVKDKLSQNIIGCSNGENAYKFFMEEIKEDALYLLDEPENSLSSASAEELSDFIYDSARFYSCQFIISTHSPFLLAIPNAKIYNLDDNPVSVERDWTNLKNIRIYYNFFQKHKREFDKK